MPVLPRLPIPNSWYAVALSRELLPGQVARRTLAGGEIVLYRTQSGQAAAVDPYCPHLGAHLGYGGTVEGDELRCPFHAFRFDTTGRCVATGYGTKPPPAARLRVWPLREANGIIFIYYDSQGCAPSWEPPELEASGWLPLLARVFPLRDHPQETVENGVDIGHFAIVHGYRQVEIKSDLAIEGPYFRVAYAAQRPMPYLGRFGAVVRFEFALHIYGLGFSLVEVRVPAYDLQARLFVLATPTGEQSIDLRLALSLKEIHDPGRIHPLLRLVPRQWIQSIAARSVFSGFVQDAQQDFPIWENKRYIHPPALAEGDGPVGRFRQWCRQFYHEADLARLTDSPAAD